MKRFLVPGICSALALMVTSASAVNLIKNGSFEDGTLSNPFSQIGAGSNAIDFWKVGGAGVDYIGNYWQAQHGSRSIDLNLLNLGSIFQDVVTVVGQVYRISFWMSGNPDTPNPSTTTYALNVSAIDLDTDTLISDYEPTYLGGSQTHSNMQWGQRWFEFTATSTSTRITFAGVAPPTPYGAALDNIYMEAVPEPFTMALMGGAAATAFAKVRRRRKTA